jgi:methylenetetrahydrofolate dehydrogenase (NADP+)/methenyltetrahydrofolate cyclohydrolase
MCYDFCVFMNAMLIDGKALAQTIRANVKTRVDAMERKPGLAILLVGNDPASHIYVRLKERACKEAGIYFEKHLYFATASEEELIAKIEKLNDDEKISGILVQLPLPSQNEDRVVAAIDPLKDVDGFHPMNLEKMRHDHPCLFSPVALGIMKLIDASGRPVTGLHAVIVTSEFFAAPIVHLLRDRGITSEVVSADDPSLAQKTKTGDILVVGIGRPGLIRANGTREGAIVIDVGTTRVDEALLGDVDFLSVSPVAGWITPVPGGVGPMTVAMLLVNVLKAQQLQRTMPA